MEDWLSVASGSSSNDGGVTGDPPFPLSALPWDRDVAPTPDSVADRLRDAGVVPHSWSNGPGDRYGAHEHGYTKLLVCAAGSITFYVGSAEAPLELEPGDGFVMPPGTRHSAAVGSAGCTCLEGYR